MTSECTFFKHLIGQFGFRVISPSVGLNEGRKILFMKIHMYMQTRPNIFFSNEESN